MVLKKDITAIVTQPRLKERETTGEEKTLRAIKSLSM
jgi:hypothetical protein